MLAEAKNRIVLVDGNFIYPTSLLVSPYLRVSYESREEAKRFYSYHLAVQAKGYIRKNCLYVDTGPPVGVVYLNVQHDTFCDGFRWPQRIEMKRGHIASRLRGAVHCGVAGNVRSENRRHPDRLFSSVETVCCMRSFRRTRNMIMKAFGVWNYRRIKFPKGQQWFALLMPLQDMVQSTNPYMP
ncbi:hypothetical protein F5Y03DRAFT_370567, partial [Xylaria venustula]